MLPAGIKTRILTVCATAHVIRSPVGDEEVAMLELGIVVLAVAGVCWLFGALIGGLFKLVFGLAGALLGGVFAVFVAGFVALLVVPIVLFALLPLLAPVLCVAGLVWLIVRATRPHPSTTAAPH
jgi:hypothetical protein